MSCSLQNYSQKQTNSLTLNKFVKGAYRTAEAGIRPPTSKATSESPAAPHIQWDNIKICAVTHNMI